MPKLVFKPRARLDKALSVLLKAWVNFAPLKGSVGGLCTLKSS
jgi:hypothetical protein